MAEEFRIERDSMGPMRVPAGALYGAQTARAVENFPISRLRFQRPFIRALGLIKSAAARVNGASGALPAAFRAWPSALSRVCATGWRRRRTR